jgi:hypothetical protein
MFPMTARAEQDLDCTDEEWAAFIRRIQEMGEQDIEKMLARQKAGTPEPKQPPPIDPTLLYYWSHLMGGGDE